MSVMHCYFKYSFYGYQNTLVLVHVVRSLAATLCVVAIINYFRVYTHVQNVVADLENVQLKVGH